MVDKKINLFQDKKRQFIVNYFHPGNIENLTPNSIPLEQILENT